MDNSFHHCLLLAQTVFQKQVVLEAAEQGLLPGQSKILDYLLSHDGCEQKALGEAFHLEAATVTGILRRMDESGLIEKHVKEGNRKSQYVFLTEKGRKMAAETVRPIMKSCEERALDGITEEEKANGESKTVYRIFYWVIYQCAGDQLYYKGRFGDISHFQYPIHIEFVFPLYARGIYGGVQCIVDSVTDFAAAEQI